MADKDKVIKEKVDHSGIFDFPSLYSYAHDWLNEEGYGVVEEKYSEKVSGTGREINIEWKASKKITDYFKIEMDIEFEIKEMTDVEAEIDGKKKKMNKGKLSLELTGNLIKDHESKWEGSPLNTFLRGIYNKYIIPSKVKSIESKIENDVKELKEQIKSFLSLTAKR